MTRLPKGPICPGSKDRISGEQEMPDVGPTWTLLITKLAASLPPLNVFVIADRNIIFLESPSHFVGAQSFYRASGPSGEINRDKTNPAASSSVQDAPSASSA
jgi:hypothetical protein